ncbi:MAG: hypothetical protein IT454_20020 [Planctomycetes bacterium]|nr:hypothetical protein [Planctomycetota bacterium]
MARKNSKAATHTIDPNLTLADLTRRYAEKMEAEGKSAGTCFSYLMELKLAQSELGAETLVSTLTPESIAAFNASKRVVKLKNGRAKSQLSVDKTRRVLRLALTWAHQSGLIAEAIVDPKRDAMPGEGASDVTLVVGDKIVNDAAPAKKRRGRKQAVTLEVSQGEAEAAADEAQASIETEASAISNATSDAIPEPTTAA